LITDRERLRTITYRDKQLNSWAMRSFRDVADGDYIAARMAIRAQLPLQFLWSSQQALEKYIKCALFIRRVPACKASHDLAPGLKLLGDAGVPLGLTEPTRKFIETIDEVGQYRYMETSIFVNWQWIVSLDRSVWELRRFATLDPRVTEAKLVDGQVAPRVRIVGGRLEEILKRRDSAAREPLLWHNAYFGRGRRTVMVRGGLTSINSPLLESAEMLDEILKYAFIPKQVVRAYRERAEKLEADASNE
jgi:hypothetical protein